jgi:hypothetical protein
MRITAALGLALALTLAARADFSYSTTVQPGAGMMAAAAAGHTTHHLVKGDKMKIDSGTNATIVDFKAQTITHVDNRKKVYYVTPFSALEGKPVAAGMDVKIDVQETGQHKTILGFNCHEVVMTLGAEGPKVPPEAGGGMAMSITMDLWVSSDVPGYQELRSFHQRMASGSLWQAMMGGGRGMQASMAEMQRKMASINGVPVLQIMKMGAAGAPDPRMAEARAHMEAMKQQGGEQAKMAERALTMMGAGGSMMEITMESSGFSTASIPSSEFAPPAGYQKIAAEGR